MVRMLLARIRALEPVVVLAAIALVEAAGQRWH